METRIYNAPISLRKDDDGNEYITGYASVFGQLSRIIAEDGKIFYERIQPGFFDDVLIAPDIDVIMNKGHDDEKMLARFTREKGDVICNTLNLEVDEYGLRYSFMPPDTTDGRNVKELVRLKNLNESSFKFSVIENGENVKWSREPDGRLIRDLYKAYGLYDTAIVTKGAYANTKVALEEMRKFEETMETKRQEQLEKYYRQIKAEL